MEVTLSPDGTGVTLQMTVGEAIALRDQLATWRETLIGGKSRELHTALVTVIPGRLTAVEPRKASRP